MKTEGQIVNYTGGKTINESEYVSITGTPYVFEDWNAGTVTFNNDKTAQLYLKYNGKDDEVYFKNDKGEAMSFLEAVKSFTINVANKEKLFRNGYPDGAGNTHNSYLEVLVDGKTQLLKKQSKSIVESKDYTSSIINKRFLDVVKYYIYTNDKLVLLKKDAKSILLVLNSKQSNLEAFIKSNNLNLKNDDDLCKLVIYYNSL